MTSCCYSPFSINPIDFNTRPLERLRAASTSSSSVSKTDCIMTRSVCKGTSNRYRFCISSTSSLEFSSSVPISYRFASAIASRTSPYPPLPPSEPSHRPLCHASAKTSLTSSKFRGRLSLRWVLGASTKYCTNSDRCCRVVYIFLQIAAHSCPVPEAYPQFHDEDVQPELGMP